MLPPNAIIAEFHAEYQRLTGHSLRIEGVYQREVAILEWYKQGFTLADLRITVAHLKSRYSRDYFEKITNFNRFIADWDTFENYLSEAKARNRNTVGPPSTKDAVLRATGRPDSQEAKVERGPVLAGEALSRKLSELSKEINKGTA
jgi:hypothetical protein